MPTPEENQLTPGQCLPAPVCSPWEGIDADEFVFQVRGGSYCPLNPPLIAAARASMRANEAEGVAREAYYKDPELCRYAAEEMKRERVEAKRLFSEANDQTMAP